MARVLVVEDDILIGMMVCDMLAELGHEPVGPSRDLASGLVAARSDTVDVAILDLNLEGEFSFPIADVLDARGIPYIFATGYGSEGGEAHHRKEPVLSKPFAADELAAALAQVTACRG